jgi:hypothetical protein
LFPALVPWLNFCCDVRPARPFGRAPFINCNSVHQPTPFANPLFVLSAAPSVEGCAVDIAE